ncbi:unnamed protein product [Tilletia caries]|nr:unnamed protein product [Tilletia caries]
MANLASTSASTLATTSRSQPSTSLNSDFSSDSDEDKKAQLPKKKTKPLSPVARLNALAKSGVAPPSAGPRITIRGQDSAGSKGKFVDPAVFARPPTTSHAQQQAAKQDVHKLPKPTMVALQDALALRPQSFPYHAQIGDALNVLQDAVNFGSDADGTGKEAFLQWLVELETLQEDPENEDNHGPSFGHNAIGNFGYRKELRTLTDIGTVRNACRLVAAMMRIWTMSTSQIEQQARPFSTDSDSAVFKHGSISGTHLVGICDKITDIFKITSAPPKVTATMGTTAANKTGASKVGASTTATSTAAIWTAGESTADATIAGATTAAAGASTADVGSIGKNAIIQLMKSNGMDMTKDRKLLKFQLQDKLVAAWKNGKIELDAKVVKKARNGDVDS